MKRLGLLLTGFLALGRPAEAVKKLVTIELQAIVPQNVQVVKGVDTVVFVNNTSRIMTLRSPNGSIEFSIQPASRLERVFTSSVELREKTLYSQNPAMRVNIQVVFPRIGVSTTVLEFGALNPGERDSLQLEVRNEGSISLYVTPELVLEVPEEFAVRPGGTLEVPAGERRSLWAYFQPQASSRKSGQRGATLRLHSNDPDNRTVELSLTGFRNSPTSSSATAVERPSALALLQNFPNPFTERTMITYELDRPTPVRLVVYNMLGAVVRVLVEAYQGPGRYQVPFESDDLPGGLYLYRLETAYGALSRKMTLLR